MYKPYILLSAEFYARLYPDKKGINDDFTARTIG